jgi:hypothetical protein
MLGIRAGERDGLVAPFQFLSVSRGCKCAIVAVVRLDSHICFCTMLLIRCLGQNCV